MCMQLRAISTSDVKTGYVMYVRTNEILMSFFLPVQSNVESYYQVDSLQHCQSAL